MSKLRPTFAQHLIAKQAKREREEAKAKSETLHNEDELVRLEDIIERGFQGFMDMGLALMQIKEQKLWKPRYASFEDYCAHRWKRTARYANYVIRAMKTAQIVGPPFPANEGVARELVKVVEQDEEQGRAAWNAFIEKNPYPTAKELRAFLRDYLREDRHTDQPARPRPQDDFTVRTLEYLKKMQSNFDADRAARQMFLMTIYFHVQEQMYLSLTHQPEMAEIQANSDDPELIEEGRQAIEENRLGWKAG